MSALINTFGCQKLKHLPLISHNETKEQIVFITFSFGPGVQGEGSEENCPGAIATFHRLMPVPSLCLTAALRVVIQPVPNEMLNLLATRLVDGPSKYKTIQRTKNAFIFYSIIGYRVNIMNIYAR